ncbi:peptide ABC transporter substrate-binding protein [Horticoccus sp. 23ND18S-11]|uniref:peptide ABC transporter substrate-binding protein n=1 Tax=Horticoccus sp. 23ND18S-11 TaxID=3391832 RepID=UPI0039C99EE6
MIRFLTGGIALAWLLVASGCGKRQTIVAGSLATQTLHLGNAEEPASLDPQINTMMAEWEVLTALFEGLTNIANDGVTILPGIAERWDIAADGLTYTFHLRKNAKWSNGDPLITRDLIASYRRMLDPKVAQMSPAIIDCVVGAKEYYAGRSQDFNSVGVKALDDFTLEFRLLYRAPYFLVSVSNSAAWGMPVHIPSVTEHGGMERRDGKWTAPGRLIGNGPFVLKEWRQNQHISVVRNEHYWDAKRVRLREVRFYPISNSAAEEQAYRAGQFHVTWDIPISKFDTYQRERSTELQRAPILETSMIVLNCSRAPFSNPDVRRAFARAIDRKVVTTTATRGRSETAHSLTRPRTGNFSPPAMPGVDVTEAQRLLAKAGFAQGKGFPKVRMSIGTDSSDALATAQTLQQMWKLALGIDVEIAPMEAKVMLASLQAHDFDLCAMGHFYALDDPIDPLMRGKSGYHGNHSGWSEPRFDALLARLEQVRSDAERIAIFTEAEQLIAQEAPYIPLYYLDRVHLMHPTVKGWKGNRFAIIDWRELWLE